MNWHKIIAVIHVIVFFSIVPYCSAYQTQVHGKISSISADKSPKIDEAIDKIILNGDDSFKGKTSSYWIEYGSKWEDEMQFLYVLPFPLYQLAFCHFYNPLTDMGYTELVELGESLLDRAVAPDNEWSYMVSAN